MTLTDDEITRIAEAVAKQVWGTLIKSEITWKDETALRMLQNVNAQVNGGPRPPPLPATTYKVVPGDTFNKIAAAWGVTPEVLQAANPQIVNINVINVGDIINIPERPAGVRVPARLPFVVER